MENKIKVETMAWDENEARRMAGQLESQDAAQVLRWAAETFSPKIALASSFGAEDVVVIDLISRTQPAISVFTLDTGRLHEETYEVMDRIRARYGIEIVSFFPQKNAVEKLEREKGFYSFRESIANRRECCAIRKVEPLNRALSGLDAWVTGLRREQSTTRLRLEKVEIDEGHGGMAKINPLADWTTEQVWDYIRKNDVPYNKLHDQNFPSIGCAPCTRAVRPGEDIRAGRWWWEMPDHKECGLHIKPNKEESQKNG